MSLEQFEGALDYALQAQGYRPVSLSSISNTGAVALPAASTPDETTIDSALRGAVATGNWGEIARQMALFSRPEGFRSIYVRRDKNVFRLAIVQRWSGLTLESAERPLREAWIVFKQLAEYVPNYQLPNKAALDQLVSQFGRPLAPGPNPEGPAASAPDADPSQAADGILALRRAEKTPTATGVAQGGAPGSSWLAIAVSVLRFIVAVAESEGAATGNLLLIGSDGLSEDLVQKLEAVTGFGHQALSLHQHELWAVGIDEPKTAVHGHTTGLDLGNLGFLLTQELRRLG